MSSTATTKLGLFKAVPSSGEPFRVSDFNSNMDKIDASSGAFICTSTTRPGAPFDGQVIKETDTKRFLVWDQGSAGWVTISGRVVCTSTSRPANPGISEEIFETDTKFVRMWTGTRWAFMGYKGDDAAASPYWSAARIAQQVALNGNDVNISAWSEAKSWDNVTAAADGTITLHEAGNYKLTAYTYSSAGSSTVTTVRWSGCDTISSTTIKDGRWRGAGFAGAGDLWQPVSFRGFFEAESTVALIVSTKNSTGTGTHGIDVRAKIELVG